MNLAKWKGESSNASRMAERSETKKRAKAVTDLSEAFGALDQDDLLTAPEHSSAASAKEPNVPKKKRDYVRRRPPKTDQSTEYNEKEVAKARERFRELAADKADNACGTCHRSVSYSSVTILCYILY